MKKIAVLGCGNGGQALSGHLSLMGHHVNLYAHPEHPGALHILQQQNGIYLTGAIKGFGVNSLNEYELTNVLRKQKSFSWHFPPLLVIRFFNNYYPIFAKGKS